MDQQTYLNLLSTRGNSEPSLSLEEFLIKISEFDEKLVEEFFKVISAGPTHMASYLQVTLNPIIARYLTLYGTYQNQRDIDYSALEGLIRAHYDDRMDSDAGDPFRIGFFNGRVYLIGGRHRCAAIAHMNRSVPIHMLVRVYDDEQTLRSSYGHSHTQRGAAKGEMRNQWIDYNAFNCSKKYLNKAVNALKVAVHLRLDQNQVWPMDSHRNEEYMCTKVLPYYKDTIETIYNNAVSYVSKSFEEGMLIAGRHAPLLIAARYNTQSIVDLIRVSGDFRTGNAKLMNLDSPESRLRQLFADPAQAPAMKHKNKAGVKVKTYSTGGGANHQMTREVCIILYRHFHGEDLNRYRIPPMLDPAKGGNPLYIAGAMPENPTYVEHFEDDEASLIRNIAKGINRNTDKLKKQISKPVQHKLFD